jgi:hypothetical protein
VCMCGFCNVWVSWSSATLTEVSPCFFLSCEANARVKLPKTGHGQQSSKLLFVLFACYSCCFVVNWDVLCICV